MKTPIKDRVRKLQKEIAEIRKASQQFMQGAKSYSALAEQERRLQRLQEILDELVSMTDWKKP